MKIQNTTKLEPAGLSEIVRACLEEASVVAGEPPGWDGMVLEVSPGKRLRTFQGESTIRLQIPDRTLNRADLGAKVLRAIFQLYPSGGRQSDLWLPRAEPRLRVRLKGQFELSATLEVDKRMLLLVRRRSAMAVKLEQFRRSIALIDQEIQSLTESGRA